MSTGNYDEMTALNFSISQEVMDDPGNIATSLDQDLSGDGRMMQQLYELKNNTTIFKEGKPGSYMEAVIGEAAINAKQANMFEEMQSNISRTVQNQRMEVSSVDLNQEMNNMIRFNQAYNAAAKMITIMDQIYDTTINRMGV
jgi:flagellar hook-associated protein 1 FlgK